MARLGWRLLHGVALLLAVSLASFVLLELAPGDFFAEMRLDPQVSPAAVQALRERYGVDRPLPERYLRWLAALGRGDLGHSFAYDRPVASLIWPRALNTLVLTVVATAAAWLLAVPLGMWWAARPRGAVNAIFSGTTALLLALPHLVIALGLLLLALRSGRLPAGGMVSLGFEQLGIAARAADLARHLLVPATALVLGMMPLLLRHVRAAMTDALASPFVTAARAHGIPEARMLFRHALPAAANPLLSLLGLSLAGLLSMSLLVEVVMSWPGLGPLLLEALLARDYYLVLAPVMASTLFLIAGNLVADALLLAFDPRIRAGSR
jgi:peptide/nickel transport system permease protein